MALTIDIRPHDPAVLVVLRGDLDLAGAPALRDALAPVVDDGARVVVDLQAVDFLDSAGLGILIGGRKRARAAGGDLALVCSSRAVLRPIEITGLDRSFAIYRDRDEALGDSD
jgi:anti-sigma B factor antagonist